MVWTRLYLRDFQCHAKLAVPLAPGVTTIVGRTDAGKSAVLRALRWLCLNRPNGTAMIRHGADVARVTLVVPKGKVERRRGKGGNLYLVNQQELKAFGADPPDVVRTLLNVGPDNFQRQHDPLFWLALSPGELAKRLNDLTGFDEADRVSAGLAARRRRLVVERDVLSDELKHLKRQAALGKELAVVCVAKKEADRAGETHAKLADSTRQLAELLSAVESAERAKDTALALAGRATAALLAATRRQSATARRQILGGLIRDAEKEKPDWLSILLAKFKVWEECRTTHSRAFDRRGTVEIGVTDHEQETKTWRQKRKRLAVLLAKAPKCPLCQTPLSRSSRVTGTCPTPHPGAGREIGTR